VTPPKGREDEEEANDRALGRGFRVLLGDVVDKFKVPIILTLILGWGGRELAHIPWPGQGADLTVISKKLDKVIKLEQRSQLTTKAIISSMPAEQRHKAEALLASSLADLSMSKDLETP
jgi:hypothetical protein